LEPVHLATNLDRSPFACVKLPPTASAGPPSSITCNAYTFQFVPAPNADQLVPSHIAMKFAGAPPAEVNSPPTYSLDPVPSSNAFPACTRSFNPLERRAQVDPSQRAIRFAPAPPAAVNKPPA